MNAAAILDDLRRHGATVTLGAGGVSLKAKRGSLPARLVDAARTAKPELAALLAAMEEDARAEFEERAAIMEFDGGMSRGEAEAAAREEISKQQEAI